MYLQSVYARVFVLAITPSNDTKQLHQASLLWRHTYGDIHIVFQSSAFTDVIARGQVIVRYFTGPQDDETERLG